MADVYGTAGNDNIDDDYPGRTDGGDRVFAGEGSDTLKGISGPDSLYGEGGADFVIVSHSEFDEGIGAAFGGEGDDFLAGTGRVVLAGGNGSDTLGGSDLSDDAIISGGDGVDWATGFVLLGSPRAYVIDLSNSNPSAVLYIDVENIRGDDEGDTLTGDFRNNVIQGLAGADTIVGGEGADILDGGIDPGPEEFQKIDTLSYAGAASGVAVQINGLGTGGDAAGDVLSNFEVLVGSEFGDVLSSDGGGRTIHGGGGADRMTGGDGADTLVGGNQADTVAGGKADDSLDGGADNDVLNGALDDDFLFGGEGLDTLDGGAGVDTLDGGLGADLMRGGAGDDKYTVNDVGDTVDESAAGSSGIDTVVASVSFSLSGPRALGAIENVTLGLSGGAINATGNAIGNRLTGNLYGNVLNGMAGADTLQGLGGDDTYYVDRATDVVFEAAGSGYDRVLASARYTLAAGQEIELLAATGAAATTGVILVGNAFSQAIRGGSGDDVLNAAGGTDTLRGYDGDDRYVVNASDMIIEGANAGFDTLEAYQSYTLAAGVSVERMMLTQGSNLTGNAFAQTLVGNGGANRLDGGAGADRMEGGAGNDTFVVDNAGDVVVDPGANGTDTVQSSLQFNLGGIRAIGAIENLLLTGTAAINGFGNNLSNRIEGNDRANILTGLGGADTLVGNDGADRLDGGDGNDMLVGGANSDTLTGGSGVDSFYFGSAPGTGGYDTLTDFSVSAETIYLGAGGFGALGQSGGLGTLKAEHFHVGAAAVDADDRIIYNAANGSLLFDPDGDGGGGAVRFAILDKGLNLSSLDFVIY